MQKLNQHVPHDVFTEEVKRIFRDGTTYSVDELLDIYNERAESAKHDASA